MTIFLLTRTSCLTASLGGEGNSVIRSILSCRWIIAVMIAMMMMMMILLGDDCDSDVDDFGDDCDHKCDDDDHHRNNHDHNRHHAQGKRKKSETAVRKSDMEYYAACIKTERSRLDWEGAVKRGVKVVFIINIIIIFNIIINIVIIFTNIINSIIVFIISIFLSSS